MRFTFSIICFSIAFFCKAQNTVGLLSYEPWASYEGYNLLYPHGQTDVYLMNNCGQIANKWQGVEGYRPNNTAYITTNGHLLRSRKFTVPLSPIYTTEGETIVESLDWEGNVIWSKDFLDETTRLHHDIEPLPNGNVLLIAWDHHSIEEAVEAGRDSTLFNQAAFSPDKILEYSPSLDSIVWIWKAWDHLVQEIDSSLSNYGSVSSNYRRLDINWENNYGWADWMHANAISYREDLDIILLNVPTFNEVWAIDHSTTVTESADSTGGNYGYGGDLLWRWGNPMAYNNGTSEDQQLFFQHDAYWNTILLDSNHPDYGDISIFNNKYRSDTSSMIIVSIDTNTFYKVSQEGNFRPDGISYQYIHPQPETAWSTGLSSMQILPNRNILICSGKNGYSYEVEYETEKIVWEYRTPFYRGEVVSQGDELSYFDNPTFNLRRYAPSYKGFDGLSLFLDDYVELDPNEEFCDRLVSTEDFEFDKQLIIYPNPTLDFINISKRELKSLQITNVYGETVIYKDLGAKQAFDISYLPAGYYIVQGIDSLGERHSTKLIKL